ncbi:MAG: hypothetical protein IPK60_24555 [Sandaracinaceae bacterium]|nr:hypothetical protein [Sandaracinaceae bacterium]
MPVLPTLALMLAEWRLAGYHMTHRRRATDDDLIVPSRMTGARDVNHAARKPQEDCAKQGIENVRHLATHTARRTFITLSLAGGASEAWLRRIAHNAKAMS